MDPLVQRTWSFFLQTKGFNDYTYAPRPLAISEFTTTSTAIPYHSSHTNGTWGAVTATAGSSGATLVYSGGGFETTEETHMAFEDGFVYYVKYLRSKGKDIDAFNAIALAVKLEPKNPNISPLCNSKSTFLKTIFLPKLLLTLFADKTGRSFFHLIIRKRLMLLI